MRQCIGEQIIEHQSQVIAIQHQFIDITLPADQSALFDIHLCHSLSDQFRHIGHIRVRLQRCGIIKHHAHQPVQPPGLLMQNVLHLKHTIGFHCHNLQPLSDGLDRITNLMCQHRRHLSKQRHLLLLHQLLLKTPNIGDIDNGQQPGCILCLGEMTNRYQQRSLFLLFPIAGNRLILNLTLQGSHFRLTEEFGNFRCLQ